MSKDRSVADSVQAQYEQWVYPDPVLDLSVPPQSLTWNGGDPRLLGAAYWPDRPVRRDLRILVAGCGSVAAARYAFQNPDARVVGVDISAASLALSERLKEKHGLHNLSLHNRPIAGVETLGQEFDLIDCTGVLHHTADPESNLKALANVLDPNGVVFLMLYGKYGRAGVYMLQEFFRILGLVTSPAEVAIVKHTLSVLGPDHAARPYIDRGVDLDFDAGVVDTFLHAQDRAYTVQDCLELLDHAGLSLQGWADNSPYYPVAQVPRDSPLFARIDALKDEQMWQAMELFSGGIANHNFYACRKSRDPATYRISFEGEGFMELVPIKRADLTFKPGTDASGYLERGATKLTLGLNTPLWSVFQQIDHRRTIWECLAAANVASPSRGDSIAFCRDMFRNLWRIGFLHFVFRSALT